MALESKSEEPLLTEQQVISQYRQLLGDCQAIRRKIAELEQESSEHE
jgi:putative ubiquitin-RnfH superfamily antitoxin RatB of RatAB toxin-antitoxin module